MHHKPIKVCTFVEKVQHVEDEANTSDMRENARDAGGARLAGAPGRLVYCSYSEHDCSFSEQNPPISVVIFYHYNGKSVFLSGLEGIARQT